MGNSNSSSQLPLGNSQTKSPRDFLEGSTFALLPREILANIFAHFDRNDLRKTALVCKTFRDYALTNDLWKTLPLKAELGGKKVHSLTSLRPRLDVVTQLYLEGIEEDFFRPTIVKEICSLRSLALLDLSSCKLKTKALKEIFSSSSFVDTLKYLDMNHCTQVTDEVVGVVCQRFRGLRTLRLRHCDITQGAVLSLCQLKELSHLEIEGLVELSDDTLTKMATECNKLTHLSIYGGFFLTAKSVKAIAENLNTRLLELCLTGSEYVDDECLKVLSNSCTELRRLTCDGCKKITDAGIAEVAQNCVALERLSLFGCREITDGAMVSVGSHCPRMGSLNLCGCRAITNQAVSHLSGLKHLRVIDMALCAKLTDKALQVMSNSDFRDSLQNLALDYIPGITEVGFELLTHFPSLTELRVSGCKLNDKCLGIIASGMPQLRVLYLMDCEQLTDVSLGHLQSNCKLLKYLNLAHCSLLSCAALEAAVDALPCLEELDIKFVSSLEPSVPRMQAKHPSLIVWAGSTRVFYK